MANRKKSLWDRDEVQFPRLLAEFAATVELTEAQRTALAQSMDITNSDLGALFDRAQLKWERLKQKHLRASHARRQGDRTRKRVLEHLFTGWSKGMIIIAACSQVEEELIDDPACGRIGTMVFCDDKKAAPIVFAGYAAWRPAENGNANLSDEQVWSIRDSEVALLNLQK